MWAVGCGLWAATAVLAQGPAARDLKFSHKLHLERPGARCVDCHAAAVESTDSADRNLPAEQTCLRCHDGVRAARVDAKSASLLQTARREIRFNHKLHVGMGNLAPILAAAIDSKKYLGSSAAEIRKLLNTKEACEACHRGLELTDYSSKANLPQMADCLVCHNKIDPPFSCEKCHIAPAVKLKPATHTPDYIDVHSSRKTKLDKPSCVICHGVDFRCMGCH